MAPTLLVGCGRLGGAILSGWRATGAVAMADLAIQTPSRKPVLDAAEADGATINPDDLSGVRRVVLAVKPAKWRAIALELAPRLPDDCTVISVMAGVRSDDLGDAFERSVARAMPTTAVAIGQGVATLWSVDARALSDAHRLFDPIARTVEVDDEALIDVATAVSGSGAAYVYAFVQALAEAGRAQGLSEAQAVALAQGTASGALALAAESGRSLDALIAEVASPGGTTEAGLKVLARPDGLSEVVADAVQDALTRARELGG